VPAAQAAGTAAPGVFSAGRRVLTIGLVMLVTLVAFESLAISTVMPLVEEDLGDLWLYGWVFSAFFLGNLVGIVVGGTASDRMRPAVPFGIGLVLFCIGLAIGGGANGMLVLVAGRALQGLGAGAMSAISYVCIGRGYPPEQRPKMFALISSAWVVPSVAGPALAGLIGAAVGWRWVFLGLLPVCAVAGTVALAGVRAIDAPERRSDTSNLLNALTVAFGAALVLAGLGTRSWWAPALVAAGLALAVPALRQLLPPGTLVARRGLPATVSCRGMLTFAFFAGDAYVPYALVSVRGMSTLVAGAALTAASITWTAASWIQARHLAEVGPSRFVAVGMAGVAVGSVSMLLVLVPWAPAWIAIACWGIGGFGIGLAYAPLSVVTLSEAPTGEEGRVTSSLQVADSLGTALGAGVAGVLLAVGVTVTASDTPGLVGVYLLGAVVALGGVVVARRVPARVASSVTIADRSGH
jgi:MFS family permease